MRKQLLLLLSFFLVSNGFFAQQCGQEPSDDVCRGVMGGLIYGILYDDEDAYNYDAAYFPNPYIDLQDGSQLYARLKVLSYLQYDNGFSTFDYSLNPSYCFKPAEPLTKIESVVYMLEAWNIEPDFSGPSPFDDIDEDDPYYGYAYRAYNEGIVTISNGDFDPFVNFTVQEAINAIVEIVNSPFHPVSEDLTDIDNYFTPGIYDPFNISHSRGMNQGVLSHYAKDSFVIPDVKMSLNFSHFYSTTMVELPNGFYQLKPLGTGWSHTYNSYITFENNVGEDNDDYYFIVWPDGTIHTYDENEEEYISDGVYDELDEFDGGDRIRIEKKDQSRYYFEQLDNDRDIWYLTEIQDPNGNEINIVYENAEEDDTKRIRRVESPSGKELNFFYENGYDFLEEIIDPIGRKIEFDVDGDNDQRLEDFTDAKGNETEYNYIENNENAPLAVQKQRFLLEEIELPRGNKITAEYDEDDAKLSSYQIDNDDPIEINVDYDYQGNQEEVTVRTPVDGGGMFEEEYEFNLNGMTTDYNSPVDDLEIDYPAGGVNVLLPSNTSLNGVDVEYDYDNDGNVTEINKENGDIVEFFEYDNDNNLTQYTDPNGNVTQFNYDNDTNLLEIIDPEGNSINFNYDSDGQLLSRTNQEGITVNYSYENDGALASVDAPEGISSSFTYDGINRMLSRNDNGLNSIFQYDENDNRTLFTNSGGFTTTYDYDANDNLSSITNAKGVATTFDYDDEDRVITETFGALTTEYEYSNEGYLEEMTKPSGDIVEYDYDDEGRLEETGTITDIDYNNRNLIESISNDSGTISFTYDNVNRVDEVNTVFGYDVKFDFEDSGHLEEIEYPTINGIEFEIDYSYDDKNRVFQVILQKNIGEPNIVIAEYDYLDDDRVEKIEYGNNTRTDYGYDNAGRLNYIEHFEIGAPTSYYFTSHTLDNRGNILNSGGLRTPLPDGTVDLGSSSENSNYSYDNNNQITSAVTGSYDVDDDGNTVQASTSFDGQYNIDDRLTDYNDSENSTDYKYNPYNQRVETTIDGVTTKFVRDVLNDNILIELDQNNNPQYYYIYHPSGMLLGRMNSEGELQYYLTDIRGSVIMMTNQDADITHQYEYEDFGWITKSFEPENDRNRFRYIGGYGVEYDKQDLYYMRARYYKPSIGRFLTEDPVWSTNLYPYADNNPITRIDSNGKYWESALDAAFLAHSYYEWQKDPSLLNSAALAFDGVGMALPAVAGIGTGIKASITGSKTLKKLGRGVDVNWGKIQSYNDGGFQSLTEHIFSRHSYYSSAPNAGKFSKELSSSKLKSYVETVLKYGTETKSGVFEFTFDTVTGVNRNGVKSNSIRVILNNGIVRTAFPF